VLERNINYRQDRDQFLGTENLNIFVQGDLGMLAKLEKLQVPIGGNEKGWWGRSEGTIGLGRSPKFGKKKRRQKDVDC